LLRKMILYFFVGVMLLISSLCLYAGEFTQNHGEL
jgi:hypothetical protein